jgi:hypothetical protein
MKFVSGDYKAATDNLNADFSGRVTDFVLRNVPGVPQYFASRSLYGATIKYSGKSLPQDPRYFENDSCGHLRTALLNRYQVPSEILQKNGQLMGNPVSFPILCAANYVAYHIALETWLKRQLTVSEVERDYPVLINGDDILFTCAAEFYSIWRKVVTDVGLEPSVGKNLFSDEILQINSELYSVKTKVIEQPFGYQGNLFPCQSVAYGVNKIPYVNFGLLTFRKKQDCSKDLVVKRDGLQTLDVTDTLDPVWFRVKNCISLRDTLFEGLDPKISKRVMRVWKQHMAPCMAEFPTLDWDELYLPTAPRERGLSWCLQKMFQNRNSVYMRFGGTYPNLSLLEPEYTPRETLKRLKR